MVFLVGVFSVFVLVSVALLNFINTLHVIEFLLMKFVACESNVWSTLTFMWYFQKFHRPNILSYTSSLIYFLKN